MLDKLNARLKEAQTTLRKLQQARQDADIAIHQTTGRIAEIEELIVEIKKEQS